METIEAMTIKEKGILISNILTQLKFMSHNEKKVFDYGKSFFDLAFMNDEQLKNIARLLRI
jgi:hypothetical protein